MGESVVYQAHERRELWQVPGIKMDPQCGIPSKPQGDQWRKVLNGRLEMT